MRFQADIEIIGVLFQLNNGIQNVLSFMKVENVYFDNCQFIDNSAESMSYGIFGTFATLIDVDESTFINSYFLKNKKIC